MLLHRFFSRGKVAVRHYAFVRIRKFVVQFPWHDIINVFSRLKYLLRSGKHDLHTSRGFHRNARAPESPCACGINVNTLRSIEDCKRAAGPTAPVSEEWQVRRVQQTSSPALMLSRTMTTQQLIQESALVYIVLYIQRSRRNPQDTYLQIDKPI